MARQRPWLDGPFGPRALFVFLFSRIETRFNGEPCAFRYQQAHQRAEQALKQEKLDALAVGLLSGALRQTEGNQKEAANLLGLKYHQLRYFIKKNGVG